MKKPIIAIASIVILVASVITLCSFTSKSESVSVNPAEVHTHMTMEGKHCNGTVGCSCSGFSPITNGEVWQQSYCKHCGHHKRCHK